MGVSEHGATGRLRGEHADKVDGTPADVWEAYRPVYHILAAHSNPIDY